MSSVSDLLDPFRALAEDVVPAFAKFAQDFAESLNDAMAPIRAFAKPWETGRELAELTVEHRLTAAERGPVRATTEFDADTVAVEFDDGTGFEEFVSYEKDAIDD